MRRTWARILLAVVAAGGIAGVAAACSSFDPAPEALDASAEGDAPDAAPDAAPPYAVRCGESTSCRAGAGGVRETCCFDRGDAATAYACAEEDKECANASPRTVRYSCDDTKDCVARGLPGNICCATLKADKSGTNHYFLFKAECTAQANCTGSFALRRCDPQVADECGAGKACADVSRFRDDNDAGSYPVTDPFPACPFPL